MITLIVIPLGGIHCNTKIENFWQHSVTSFLCVNKLEQSLQKIFLDADMQKNSLAKMFLFITIVFSIATIILNISNCVFEKQWKPLNAMTLGQRETDNINQMITITGYFL
jgi:hypothetical protein